MSTLQHDAWHAALEIVKALRAHGHTTFLAGGCVRDKLLSITPKDYDIATDATPLRVCEVFPKARKVGTKFGVVLVQKFGFDMEVATFRSDGPYSDGRRPDVVVFGSDLEDAKRRDFTINGLFFDPIDGRVIDHVDGRNDLTAGLIRTIGSAQQRFAEDHLRMLRAVRLAAKLEFRIETETLAAIQESAQQLLNISPERVWMELEQILTSPTRSRGWTLLRETGLRPFLSSAWKCETDEEMRVLNRLNVLPTHRIDPSLALATTVCDRTPPQIEILCRSLRLSNRLGAAVDWLTRALQTLRTEPAPDLADLKILLTHEEWPNLCELWRADQSTRGGDSSVCDALIHRAEAIATELIAPPPFLTGDDLQALGLPPGQQLGRILEMIYRAQLNETIESAEEAVVMARRLIAEKK